MLLAAVLALSIAFTGNAQAQKIPSGSAPSAQLAALAKGFTLNAEVLGRYGYTLDKYNTLDVSERRRVGDWIEVLEHDRLLAEYGKSQTDQPRLKLTRETEAAMARLNGQLAAGFDGGAKTGSGGSSWVPSLSMRGPGAPNGDATDYSGTVRRLSLTNPEHDLTLSYGQLGADGASPLVAPSPYFGAEKGWRGSGAHLDYSGRASLYSLDLGARLYPNDDGPVDARIDQGLQTARGLAPTFGIDPSNVDKLGSSLGYSTSFDRERMWLGSAMGSFGRAYRLLGDELHGVDWGWSVMGLLRLDQFFPNANLDQTAGLRVRPNRDHNIGLFGGVTEGISVLAHTAVADSIAAGTIKTDVHPEAAPHATVAAWGKMPYLSGVEYEVSAGRQWNPWTTVTKVAGSITADAGKGVKVGAFGSYSDESGADIEYERGKSSAGVMVQPTPGMGISAQYFNQNAALGDARVVNQGVLLGLTLKETAPGGGPGGSVTMESLFGGRDQLVPAETSSDMVQTIEGLLNLIRTLKDSALAQTGGAGQGWSDVQAGWAKLPPAAQAALSEAWSAAAPSGPSLAQVIATKPSNADALNKLIDLVADTKLMERMLVRAMRHQILEALAKVDVPILGSHLKLNAPTILAAANAYSLSLTPLPGVTAADARGALDPLLLNQLTGQLGCDKGAQPQATTDCILSKLPKDQADKYRAQYGDAIDVLLKTAVQWPSDVIRREMNQTMLQVILAAETLNELTVDKGERIGDLNVGALYASFRYLDERSKRDNKAVLTAAAEDLKAELAAQDAAMRAELSDYGASRLGWLQSQPAWPANVRIAVKTEDWAPILAVYGDKAFFDLILKSKAKLEAKGGGGLLISMDRVSPLNSLTVLKGDPAELRLPPKRVDLSAFELSF